MTNQNQKTDILAVKLVPGPNGAPLGKVLRVHNITEAVEKNVSSYMRDVTSRLADVAFDLPVSADFQHTEGRTFYSLRKRHTSGIRPVVRQG